MTAAFYYPTVIERVICEKCGTVKSEEVTPARVMAQPVIASIEVPANTVSGYSLMQINADGTRSEERRVGKECRSRWSPYH